LLETLFLSLNYEKSECINLKNCALGGSIILSTGGSIFVSAEGSGSQVNSNFSK
jgi:hypothetical protein